MSCRFKRLKSLSWKSPRASAKAAEHQVFTLLIYSPARRVRSFQPWARRPTFAAPPWSPGTFRSVGLAFPSKATLAVPCSALRRSGEQCMLGEVSRSGCTAPAPERQDQKDLTSRAASSYHVPESHASVRDRAPRGAEQPKKILDCSRHKYAQVVIPCRAWQWEKQPVMSLHTLCVLAAFSLTFIS